MVSRVSKRLLQVLMLLVLGLFLASCDINQHINNEYHYYDSSPNPQVNEVYKLLNQYYYEELPINVSRIQKVEDLLKYVDNYTYIYQGARSIDQGEKYLGIGITITDHNEGLLITDVNYYVDIDDRVFAGDIIKGVDGESIKGLEFEDKTLNLKGEENQILTLSIMRLGYEIEVEVPIIEIPSPSVEYKFIEEGKIGFIKILRFEYETHVPFNDALIEFENSGMETLIIDVRDNGGGYVNSTIEILKNFVYGDEPYVYLYNVKANAITSYKPLKEATRKNYEIITLINGSSASASEMLAGSLNQFGYKTFGEKTYGKDVFQASLELQTFEQNTMLSLTFGYWLLKDQTTVRGGIEPTIYHKETGYKMYGVPTLNKTFEKGDASSELMIYQYLISLELEGRFEYGLFDQQFQELLVTYQYLKDLPLSGKLDVFTMQHLIVYYRNLVKEGNNDNLLNEAIKYAQSSN